MRDIVYRCGYALMPPWRVCDVRCARSALGLANAENAVTALPKRMRLPDSICFWIQLRSVRLLEQSQAAVPRTKCHQRCEVRCYGKAMSWNKTCRALFNVFVLNVDAWRTKSGRLEQEGEEALETD